MTIIVFEPCNVMRDLGLAINLSGRRVRPTKEIVLWPSLHHRGKMENQLHLFLLRFLIYVSAADVQACVCVCEKGGSPPKMRSCQNWSTASQTHPTSGWMASDGGVTMKDTNQCPKCSKTTNRYYLATSGLQQPQGFLEL